MLEQFEQFTHLVECKSQRFHLLYDQQSPNIVLRIEPKAALRAGRGADQADLLPISDGSQAEADPFGDGTDLKEAIGVGHRHHSDEPSV
jgi:hypothetical protein